MSEQLSWKPIAGLLFALGMLLYGAAPRAEERSRAALTADLFNVITLEGFHCVSVTNFGKEGADRFVVSCRNGKRYDVHVERQAGHVSVSEHGIDGARAGRGAPGHEAFVRHALFTIISLAGEDCERAVSFERVSPREHVAECSNGRRYRVRVSQAGRTVVEAQ